MAKRKSITRAKNGVKPASRTRKLDVLDRTAERSLHVKSLYQLYWDADEVRREIQPTRAMARLLQDSFEEREGEHDKTTWHALNFIRMALDRIDQRGTAASELAWKHFCEAENAEKGCK